MNFPDITAQRRAIASRLRWLIEILCLWDRWCDAEVLQESLRANVHGLMVTVDLGAQGGLRAN